MERPKGTGGSKQRPVWSARDEEIRKCEEWLKDTTINPDTGHVIDRGGPTYRNLTARCKELGLGPPRATGNYTWQKCQEWRKNPGVNPDSGKAIKIGGPMWNKINNACSSGTGPSIKLEGTYFPPDGKGLVPAVASGGRWFIVRKISGVSASPELIRKVFGPLNKPAREIQLVYYGDTWDFKQGHYKPVFLTGNVPKRPPAPPRGPQARHLDLLTERKPPAALPKLLSSSRARGTSLIDRFV